MKKKLIDGTFIATIVVCLLPIIPGLIFWNKLPSQVAIHFDINSQADNWAPKWFFVYIVPIILAAICFFQNFIINLTVRKESKKIGKQTELISKWIIPIVSIFVCGLTIVFNIGIDLNIFRIASVFISVVIIITANYLPKNPIDSVKFALEYESDKKKRSCLICMSILWILGALINIIMSFTKYYIIGFFVFFVILIISGIIVPIIFAKKPLEFSKKKTF